MGSSPAQRSRVRTAASASARVTAGFFFLAMSPLRAPPRQLRRIAPVRMVRVEHPLTMQQSHRAFKIAQLLRRHGVHIAVPDGDTGIFADLERADPVLEKQLSC